MFHLKLKKMNTFQTTVQKEFRCYLNTQEVARLSNRLLIVATAVDNPALDDETGSILFLELQDIKRGFISSDYKKKIEVLNLISQMEYRL